MKKIVEIVKEYKYLIIVMLVGLVLRLPALAHGYPYIFNIDEPGLIRSSLGVRFSFWIDHFDWPHLNFYLNALFFEIYIKFRAILQILNLRSTIEPFVPIMWDDPFIFYFLSRFLNTLYIVFSAIPLFLTIRKLVPEKYALRGILLFFLIPYVIVTSQFALQEPGQLFFIAWALYFCSKIIEQEKWKYFIYFGIFIGLATGIKYNAAVFGFLPLFLYLNKSEFIFNNFKKFIYKLTTAGFVSILVFIATTPSMIRDWEIFWSYTYGRGVLWQLFMNVKPLTFEGHMHKLWENIISLSDELSPGIYLLLIVSILVIVYEFFKNRSQNNKDIKVNFVYVFFFCAYFFYISRYGRSGGHYFFPIYIFIPFFFSYILKYLDDLSKNIKGLGLAKKVFIIGVYLITIGGVLESQTYLLAPNPYVEGVNYVKSIKDNYDVVYVDGDNFKDMNIINNLGFKIYREDSKIESKSIYITEKSVSRPELELIKQFENITIYVNR